MSFVKFSATILLIIALLSPGLAASGFENSPFGIQGRGLAGAFRAVADDWTAAYYNPAGYALIQDNQLGATTGLVHVRNELNPTYRIDGVYEIGVFNDQINYNKHEVYSNPSGGFVARLPFFGETVMGLSIYQPFDNNITWKLYDMPSAYNDSLTVPDDQFSNNLDVVAFQLTAARELVENKVSFGVGLQILRADLIFTDLIFRDNPYLDNDDLTQITDRPYDKITEWNHNDGNGWGFGLTGGLLFSLTEKLNLGVTASLPFDITISGTSKLEYYMPLNPSMMVGNNAAGEEITAGTPEYLFIDGSKIVDTADFETELKLPASMGLGLAYEVNEKLMVAFDASYTLWSKYEGLDFAFSNHRGLTGAADSSLLVSDFLTADLSNPVEWKDAAKFMLGVRYHFKDYLTLLAGGSMDQSPARESVTLTPQFVDTGDKNTISGGVIYHRDQWDFGLSGSYTSYPDQTASELLDVDGDGLADAFAGEYKASTYETVLSFNYRF